MSIYDSQGNPANTYFGPIMSAIDLMTKDAIAQREGEKERNFRREYWQEQDRVRKEDRAIAAERDTNTKIFQSLMAQPDEELTDPALKNKYGTMSKLFTTGKIDPNVLSQPLERKPEKTIPISKLIDEYFPDVRKKYGGEIAESMWKFLQDDAQKRYDQEHPRKTTRTTPKYDPEKDDPVLRDLNAKKAGATSLSRQGSQNAKMNDKGEISYGKTPVDRTKYAKYIKIVEKLGDKKRAGNWTTEDQKYLDNLQEYDYYESSGEDIPEYGKPESKKKISGVNWVR